MPNDNNLCKKDSEEQYTVHFLRYEYIERLRCMTKLLLLFILVDCTLLYHVESMLCYFLVPELQEKLLCASKVMSRHIASQHRAKYSDQLACLCEARALTTGSLPEGLWYKLEITTAMCTLKLSVSCRHPTVSEEPSCSRTGAKATACLA